MVNEGVDKGSEVMLSPVFALVLGFRGLQRLKRRLSVACSGLAVSTSLFGAKTAAWISSPFRTTSSLEIPGPRWFL